MLIDDGLAPEALRTKARGFKCGLRSIRSSQTGSARPEGDLAGRPDRMAIGARASCRYRRGGPIRDWGAILGVLARARLKEGYGETSPSSGHSSSPARVTQSEWPHRASPLEGRKGPKGCIFV